MSENHVETGANKRGKGVNPVYAVEKIQIGRLFLLESIEMSILLSNMLLSNRMTVRKSFKLLLLIYIHGYKHRTYLRRISHMSYDAITTALTYLDSVGYITTSSHARLVYPFGAFMFDTTYVVTREGREVIRRVLEVSGILGEK